MQDKYIFKPYSPLFPRLFVLEKRRLEDKLVGLSPFVEHVGSTAIPGLGGKGIIDIGIGVASDKMEPVKELTLQLGYEFNSRGSSKDRLFCRASLPDPIEKERVYHLHITSVESQEWRDLLRFRDHLRRSPKDLAEYAKVKEDAVMAGLEGALYRKAKDDVLRKILATSVM